MTALILRGNDPAPGITGTVRTSALIRSLRPIIAASRYSQRQESYSTAYNEFFNGIALSAFKGKVSIGSDTE